MLGYYTRAHLGIILLSFIGGGCTSLKPFITNQEGQTSLEEKNEVQATFVASNNAVNINAAYTLLQDLSIGGSYLLSSNLMGSSAWANYNLLKKERIVQKVDDDDYLLKSYFSIAAGIGKSEYTKDNIRNIEYGYNMKSSNLFSLMGFHLKGHKICNSFYLKYNIINVNKVDLNGKIENAIIEDLVYLSKDNNIRSLEGYYRLDILSKNHVISAGLSNSIYNSYLQKDLSAFIAPASMYLGYSYIFGHRSALKKE